jgi:ABC-type multidrug transport system ATPase subunit
MKQKLALSCALVHRPDLLLLDEPTTGVDAVSRREFWDQLDALKRSGLTIVVSTPYMDEALRCDRVALIQEGRILDIDAPRSIGSRFRHPLVSITTSDRYRVLTTVRSMPNAHSAYPFGEALHYADRREIAPEQLAVELQAELRHVGFADAKVHPVPPGIEDVFMELMNDPGVRAA